jgi:hypothetical protein
LPLWSLRRPGGISRDRQQSSFCRAGDVRTLGSRGTRTKSRRVAVVCPSARMGLSQSRQSAQRCLTTSSQLALKPRDPVITGDLMSPLVPWFHKKHYANNNCSGHLVMRHLGQLEMRHPRVFGTGEHKPGKEG